MHVRFIIFLIVAVLSAPAIFAQGTNQPTVDELVAKNVEAKGGANSLKSLQTLRSTGKFLVQKGQIDSVTCKQKSSRTRCAPKLRSRG